jgi:hypothetical protein
MAITINNFEIINSGQQLAIDVETGIGYNITSILLWNIDTFKDYTLATSLNYKLEQINNREIFIVEANELGILEFKDIYFIEIEGNEPDEECSTCLIPALGITYNILPYYQCMLNYLLKAEITDCVTCNDMKSKNLLITINLLIDSIEKSLDLGYYLQAIDNIKRLKKLCSLQECTNCKNVICNSCSKFKQLNP